MSSWSILTGASGYEYDGTTKSLRFTPRITPEKFKSFFAGPEGWGSLEQIRADGKQRNEIHVVEGQLVVNEIRLAPPGEAKHLVLVGVPGRQTYRMTQDADGVSSNSTNRS